MAIICLIKYPQSELDTLNVLSPFPAEPEPGLTQEGRRAASNIGENLARYIPGRYRCWSGPAKRCAQAVEVLARSVGGEPQIDERLDERRLFREEPKITVQEFRLRQERGFLDPSRLGEGELETPISHRLRVESWLAEVLPSLTSDDVIVVVSHGAVVEHLHSALSGRPPEAMANAFSFCAPAHGHLWSSVRLPNERRMWCCLGSNIDLSQTRSLESPMAGLRRLSGLAVDLAADPRFKDVTSPEVASGNDVYYIR